MKMTRAPFKTSLILLIAVIFQAGIARASIEDVETAIISKDYDQAKQIALEMLDLEQESALKDELKYYIGLSDLRLGQYQQAKKIFNEVIVSDANVQLRDKAYLGLFDVYFINEQYKKANKIINKLIRISPDSEYLSLIYLKSARANIRLARWYKAREYLTKIIAEFPQSMEVHVAKQLLNEEQYFAVQVGAFLERDRAEKLSLELQDKGEYAYIIETLDQRKRKFYRVRVGQLVQLDNAQKLRTKLSQEGYPTQIYP